MTKPNFALKELVLETSAEEIRQRVEEFCREVAGLEDAILNLQNSVLSSNLAQEYSNPQAVADFYVGQILRIGAHFFLDEEKEVFGDGRENWRLEKSLTNLLGGREVKKVLDVIEEHFNQNTANPHLLSALGGHYLNGKGVQQDLTKAADLFTKAADQEYAAAQYALATCYYYGKGVKKDLAKAAKFFEKAADQGLAEGQYSLANCYRYGRGVEKDFAKAAIFLQKAADQGLAEGQYGLATCYRDGKGVEQNLSKATNLFCAAANQGMAKAQYFLATHYQAMKERTGGTSEEALNLFEKAADQGLKEAQYALAACYESGIEVEEDVFNLFKAIDLYQKAAAQGHEEAKLSLFRINCSQATSQFDLALSYQNGKKVEKDSTKALILCVRSANLFAEADKFVEGKGDNQPKSFLELPGSDRKSFALDKSAKNSALSFEEISEIAQSAALRKNRISNNRSKLIGEIVEISKAKLEASDLINIHTQLKSIDGINPEKSKSCKIVSQVLAEKTPSANLQKKEATRVFFGGQQKGERPI